MDNQVAIDKNTNLLVKEIFVYLNPLIVWVDVYCLYEKKLKSEKKEIKARKLKELKPKKKEIGNKLKVNDQSKLEKKEARLTNKINSTDERKETDDNINDVEKIFFIMKKTRDYLCHMFPILNEQVIYQMMRNMKHLYKCFGVDLNDKIKFRKMIDYDYKFLSLKKDLLLEDLIQIIELPEVEVIKSHLSKLIGRQVLSHDENMIIQNFMDRESLSKNVKEKLAEIIEVDRMSQLLKKREVEKYLKSKSEKDLFDELFDYNKMKILLETKLSEAKDTEEKKTWLMEKLNEINEQTEYTYLSKWSDFFTINSKDFKKVDVAKINGEIVKLEERSRSDYDNDDMSRPSVLYFSFGYLLHHLVGTRFESWSIKTKEFTNYENKTISCIQRVHQNLYAKEPNTEKEKEENDDEKED